MCGKLVGSVWMAAMNGIIVRVGDDLEGWMVHDGR